MHVVNPESRWTWGAWVAALAVGGAGIAQAQEDSADTGSEAGDSAGTESAPEGILPIPSYPGAVFERTHLLGDFNGGRTSLAQRGVQFDMDLTQHLQGVVSGGRDVATRYGGSLDYLLQLDLQRMGVLPGALVTARGESRYGDSVNTRAGSLLPVNTDMYFPMTTDPDDGIALTITELTYTQYLSPTVAVFAGKLNTLGGDANEFASGRGKTQFGNAHFVFNPVTALTVPYSTLGGGALWAVCPQFTIVGSVFNTADSSTTSGFDDFGDGWTFNAEAQLKYELGRQPGGQNLGFIYGGDGDFVNIRTKFTFDEDTGLAVNSEDDTWALYWSGWQYLWSNPNDDTPINPANGKPDRRGIGLFARAGIGDNDTLPIDWHLSGGLGGRGPVDARADDHYGVGYYYSSIERGRFAADAGLEDHTQGFEAFYNASLTPATDLTLSAQVVDGVNSRLDTATILGVRLQLRF